MQSRFTFLVPVVAIVALVFAIWPAVADAPWEEEAAVVESESPDPRCEGALIMKAEARVALAQVPRGGIVPLTESNTRSSVSRQLKDLIEQADREVRRFC